MTEVADILRRIELVFLGANRLPAFRHRACRGLASKRAGPYWLHDSSALKSLMSLGDCMASIKNAADDN